MDSKPILKFAPPVGLAALLLVVLHAQNQEPASTPPATGATPAPPTPPTGQGGDRRGQRTPIVRPRSVAPPPPAATTAGTPASSPATSAAAPATVTPAAVPAPAPPAADAAAAAPAPPVPTPAVPAATPPTVRPTTAPSAVPGLMPPNPVITRAGVDSDVPEIEWTESTPIDINIILDKYEQLTDRNTMRDGQIQGTQLPLKTNGKLTRKQAGEYIKAFLLLNGVSIVPSDIPRTDKVVPTQKLPQLEQGASERPVYTEADKLPENEQIINYVMYFTNVGADEALRSLQQVIQPTRAASKMASVPAAGAVIITDNIPAIRVAQALKAKIDVPAARVVKKFFQLERADAEEVAQVLTDILAAQSKLRNQQSGSTGGRSVGLNAAAQQLSAGLPPGVVNPQTNTIVNAASPTNGQAAANQPPDESTVIVKAITRTNEVLISGRPSDIPYLEELIKELDKEANVKNLQRFQLRFIRVEDFLTVAQDAISRGQEEIAGGGGGAGAPGGAGARTTGTTNRNTGTQGGFGGAGGFGGNTGFGTSASSTSRSSTSRSGTSSSFSGSGGSSSLSRGRSSGSGGSTAELVPSSLVIGKTLLIAEPRSNTLLVAGPPEHLDRIQEVIAQMDRRPLQVSISAVIAEVTLTDGIQHGIDILRRAESVVAGGQNINFAGTLTNIGSATGIIDLPSLTTLDGFSGIGSGMNLYAQFGELFNTYIKALESTSRVQVISRPFIFTANNKEAAISIGRRVPVPASSQSSVVTGNTTTFNTNIEYEDVNLEIVVTPLINSKDEVTLTVSQTNDDVLNYVNVGNQSAPTISQQALNTEVAVPNGGVAVIGGLIRDKNNADHNGLPWITRIPVVRSLLGNTKKTKERGELLIFIQPRIVETSEELEAMHTDHLRRTVIGKEAEDFAQPPFNTKDVVLPTDEGDIPLNNSHQLLPSADSAPPVQNSTIQTVPEKNVTPIKVKGKSEAPVSRGTIPNENPKPAFWEDKPAATDDKPKSSSGLKKILPWNWGKKES